MPYLVQRDNTGAALQFWNLHEGPLVIGRSEVAESGADDDLLSRQHFEISKHGKLFRIKDLSSRNGTFVNDKAATDQELAPNDRIRAGKTLFMFCEGLATLAGKVEKDIADLGKFADPPAK